VAAWKDRQIFGIIIHHKIKPMSQTKLSKVIAYVAPSLKQKAARKAKKNQTHLSELVRNFLQNYVKG
jgi:hypothetical protein